MISNKREKIKQELASLCIKSGYQASSTPQVTRNVNVVKGPPHHKEVIKSSYRGHSESRTTATCLTPDVALIQTNVCLRSEHSQSQCIQKEGEQQEESLFPEKPSWPFLMFSQRMPGPLPTAHVLRHGMCEEALERTEEELWIHSVQRELPLDCLSAMARAGSKSPAATPRIWHKGSSPAHSEHAASHLERRLWQESCCAVNF